MILGVILKKKKKKPYDDYAAQLPFAEVLLTDAGMLLSSSGTWLAAGGCQPISL